MEFWRYYRIIRKRRWLIILGMVLCVGAVAMSNLNEKPMFTGRTTLMEAKGMSDKGVSLFQEPYMPLDTQLRLSNLGQLATSQRVLSNARDTLRELGLTFPADQIGQVMSVQPVKDTNILAIEVTLPDAEEAKVAADVVASEFRKVYAELNNDAVRQSREFIEAEIETTRRAMVHAQGALRGFKEENGIISLENENTATVQRLAGAKTDLNNSLVALKVSTARVDKLDEELKTTPEWMTAAQTISRDPQWERLRQQLVDLKTSRASQLGLLDGNKNPEGYRRLANHPQVVDVQRQIDKVEDDFEKAKQEFISSTSESKNPAYQSTMDRWLSAKVDQNSAVAQQQAMQNVLSNVRGELSALPAKEEKLAELMADLNASTDTYALMKRKLDEARLSEQQAKNEVALKVVDPAYVYPVKAKGQMKLIMAFLLSPLLGIGVAFLLHYTDNSIKTASDAEKLLGLPVLSVVPSTRAHCLPRQRCPEIIDVAYQMLTSSLWIASQNQDVNSIAVVSAEPDVGRSITAANLAVCLAREGARVVLVDSDLRQPTQHLIFGADNKVGLTNLLSGAATVEDVLVPTKVQGLLLVPTGPVPDNPVKLLRSSEMSEFATQIRDVADFVIYDTPAGVAFPDPILVAPQAGSALIVHSAGRVPRGSEAEFRARLESVGVRVLGAVLNKVKREDSSGYFHYHRSYAGINVGKLPGDKKAVTG